jgi:hypothetical protein
MVQGKTHYNLTRSMFPYLNATSVKNVNTALDHPTLLQKEISRSVNRSPYFIPFPGLSRRGHRTINHDLASALMTGYAVGGPDGITAAWAHLMEDAMSDTVAKVVSPEGRDIFEALYNYNRKSAYRLRRKYKKNAFGF